MNLRFSTIAVVLTALTASLAQPTAMAQTLSTLTVVGSYPLSCDFNRTSFRLVAGGVQLNCAGEPTVGQATLVSLLEGITIGITVGGVEQVVDLGSPPSGTTWTTTPSTGGQNQDPQAVNDVRNGVGANSGPLPVPVLNNDSDPDGDTLVLETVVPAPGSDNLGTAETNGNLVRYLPPATLASDHTDRFVYTISDNHGGTAEGNLLVELTSAPPAPTCHRTNGGSGCLGQTLDGRWFSLDEELAGETAGAALYQGLNATNESFTLGLFSSPSRDKETHWGCRGADTYPGRPWAYPSADEMQHCFSGSLKNRTYVVRLPVVNGLLKNSSILISPQSGGSDHHHWIFALADQPYDLTNPAPAGVETCEYRTPRAGATFSSYYGCPVYSDARDWTGTKYLYLMMRPGDGARPATQCDWNNYRCRVYVKAWGKLAN